MEEHVSTVSNRLINDGFGRRPSPESPQQSQQSRVGQERMKRLWVRMIHIYGHKWTTNYGSKPNETWSQACGKLSPDLIGVGLKSCMDRTDQWPPTLPEFLQGCYKPASPKAFSHRQIADKHEGPEFKAYMDCNRDMSPGDPGYKEYFRERMEFYTAEMGQ